VNEGWINLRGCSYFAASLLALFSAPYPSVAQAPLPQAPPAQASAGTDSARSAIIYVVRRGWHIDIGFAAAALQPPLESLASEFPGVQYLFFGFGDQRYLLAQDRNAAVLLAALWPGRGMILATALTSPPQESFGVADVIALPVTARQARDAQTFIWQSLDDPLKSYASGAYDGSLYFTATPKYSALHTCNTWAAESLAAAALPIQSVGVVFAGQLWIQVRRLEKEQGARTRQSATARHPAIARRLAARRLDLVR
jgi:hypothetical protein